MQPTQATPARSAAASPYANQTITKLPNWGSTTAWDIWFNNLSIGTFLVVAVGALISPTAFAPLTPYAYPLALLLLIVDLLLLVTDLGDPLRFHHMLRVFKLSSPMSFGTWSLSGYGVLLGVASVVAVLNWPLFASVQDVLMKANMWSFIEGVGRIAAVIGIVPALGGILYKGVLFSVTSQPGWKDARSFGGYITNSAILLGCAVVLGLALIIGQDKVVAPLRAALLALLLVDAILLWVLYRSVAVVWRGRYSLKQRRLLTIAIIVGGFVVPFAVLLQGSWLFVASLLVLLSALTVRYAWVFLPRQRSSP
jgi:Ni/Fe-hydrogenase subunit HybB-like protein